MVNRLDDLNGLRKCGQKSTARGSRFTNRLDSQADASRCSYRRELLKGLQHQSACMRQRVPATAASVDHECVGLELFSGIDGLAAVINTFPKRAAVATGETTGPLEAGNLHGCSLKEAAGLSHADIGKLGTP